MRKVIVIAACVALTWILAGCGGSSETQAEYGTVTIEYDFVDTWNSDGELCYPAKKHLFETSNDVILRNDGIIVGNGRLPAGNLSEVFPSKTQGEPGFGKCTYRVEILLPKDGQFFEVQIGELRRVFNREELVRGQVILISEFGNEILGVTEE